MENGFTAETILQGVSRETRQRLTAYADLLLRWQHAVNLISPASVPDLWRRHIVDSLQLVALAPEATSWADLGSGAGLPGLVIACALADHPGRTVHLVESNQKKASFLRHASVELGLPTQVHADRIDNVTAALTGIDVVTARALAPLDALLRFSNLLLKNGATGLFPKGRDVDRELTTARKNWHFNHRLHDSITDPKARIVEIKMSEDAARVRRINRLPG